MKITIASGIFPPDIGGPATYSQLIAREFSKRNIDVKVICYSDEDSNSDNVIRILRKQNKLIRYWLYFWNLLKLSKDADVIYAQGPLAAGMPTMWVSKILRKKFVIKIVGDYAWEQGVNQFGVKDLIEPFQKKRYSQKVEKIRKIQKRVVKSANKVIVPSEFLKKIVAGWGIKKNKIEVIYNAGPDLEKMKKIKTDKEVETKGDIINSAGRLMPWKGMDALKEIMPDLLKQNPKFKLIIATKLPHKELMAKFKASKIFVLNSGYEGLPHIVLEAMACGLPVITTNVCGNPEVVKDNYNGLLIEYNNKKQLKEAILKLWKDRELQKKFIENGYKTLEKFKQEDMINKTLKVLKS